MASILIPAFSAILASCGAFRLSSSQPSLIFNVTGTSTIQSTYDGVTTSSGAVAGGTASYTFNKNKVGVTKAFFTLSATEESTIDLKVTCPDALQMSLIQICISSDDDSAELIHNEYRWDDTSYVSPLHSNQVTLGSGTGLIISQYLKIDSPQGGAVIPADGATVSVRSNRITASGDDFDFNTAQHELLFLRSSTLYNNNTTAVSYTHLTLPTNREV